MSHPEGELEDDYKRLLDPNHANQFESRVGLARVALAGMAIGFAFGAHVVLLLVNQYADGPLAYAEWCVFVLLMCVYHSSEFFVTAYYHPKRTSYDSFMMNQSTAFVVAILASVLEFWLEALLLPGLKTSVGCFGVGFSMALLGQILRSGAMIQAGANFTHLISTEKAREHRLVTTGLYSVLRHPGYTGWFWWSVGTQIMVGNPICAVLYFLVAQRFFKGRIPMEEATLTSFFPNEYPAYRARTWILVPGV